MKKYISLALAVLMLSLTLCACDDEMANDLEKLELFEKYEDLIDAIEDEDYDEAIGELDGFFDDKDDDEEDVEEDEDGEDVETETDTDTDGEHFGPSGDDEKDEVPEENKPVETVPPETEFVPETMVPETEPSEEWPEETEPSEEWPEDTTPPVEEPPFEDEPSEGPVYDTDDPTSIALGRWVRPSEDGESFEEIIIYDGKLEMFGEAFEWYLDPVTVFDNGFCIDVCRGDDKVYKLDFYYSEYDGYWLNYIYVFDETDKFYEYTDYEAGINYDHFDIVELTAENFFDYFEYVETVEDSYAADGSLETITFRQKYILKQEYITRFCYDLSEANAMITYYYAHFNCDINYDTLEITLKDTTYVSDITGYDFRMYYNYDSENPEAYFSLNSSYITSFDNPIISVYYDLYVDSVEGVIFLAK